MYKMLGTSPVTFLFTDAHIAEEGFLEIINNILTTGMVPALYEADEKEAIVSQTREAATKAGIIPTGPNIWKFFISQCRHNLHVVLAMTPSGDDLRTRCRNFPGLISATVIDWFFTWPRDALHAVAQHFLKETPLPEANREDIYTHIVQVHCDTEASTVQFMQELRRYYTVTPKNFLDYLTNYKVQLQEKEDGIETSIARLEGGLEKLVEAAADVAALTVEVQAQKVVVDAKTVDVTAVKNDIAEKTIIANAQQEEAQIKAQQLEAQAIVIEQKSAEAQADLDLAQPALEAAAAALDGLQQADLTQLKSFSSPHPMLQDVANCLIYLQPVLESGSTKRRKIFEPKWGTGGRQLLGTMGFLNMLKGFDKDSLNDKKIKKVERLLQTHTAAGEPMTVETLIPKSTAAAGLFRWVIAVVEYYGVAKRVKPLTEKVKLMEQQQMESEKGLVLINANLAALTEQLDALNAEFKLLNDELTKLRDLAQTMERRLQTASKLIKGLGGERTRWTTEVAHLKGNRGLLVGDCLLAASFLSYLGAFTFSYRTRLLNEAWRTDLAARSIPHTEEYSLRRFLVGEAVVQGWVGEGLPADDNSVQNGILATNASRFPLCIDPQEQAVRWIKNREGANLRIKTFASGDFMKFLELCVGMGFPFLFQNCTSFVRSFAFALTLPSFPQFALRGMIKMLFKNNVTHNELTPSSFNTHNEYN